MDIGQAIKTKGFKDNWQKAVINITFTNNYLSKELERRANRYEITLQQFNALRILRGQYPKAASNNLIKERMLNSMSDISRLVDRIVAKGLVSRTQCAKDKRSVDLVITEKGLQLLEEVEEEMMLSDLLPHNLTEEEAGLLSDLLDKLRGGIPNKE